jgi:hypothetical protein
MIFVYYLLGSSYREIISPFGNFPDRLHSNAFRIKQTDTKVCAAQAVDLLEKRILTDGTEEYL